MSKTHEGVCGQCGGEVYHDGTIWRHTFNHEGLDQCPPTRKQLAGRARLAANILVEAFREAGSPQADYDTVWAAKEWLHDMADVFEKPQPAETAGDIR